MDALAAEAQSRLNSNAHDATPDQDVPPAPEAARARDAGSSTTTATPHPSAAARVDASALLSPTTELNDSETQCLEGIRVPRGRVPPSPTTLLIEQAERGVREAVESIPGEGILTPLTGRQKQHSQ